MLAPGFKGYLLFPVQLYGLYAIYKDAPLL